tara:strand:+ start:914 stop:1192 length:279 start_codon:yes stop_codon:yes gene_type:complete
MKNYVKDNTGSNVYVIDEGSRFLIKNPDTIDEEIITDLGGSHDLVEIYIKLAIEIWDIETLGHTDLLEKESNKGFDTWKYKLQQIITKKGGE